MPQPQLLRDHPFLYQGRAVSLQNSLGYATQEDPYFTQSIHHELPYHCCITATVTLQAFPTAGPNKCCDTADTRQLHGLWVPGIRVKAREGSTLGTGTPRTVTCRQVEIRIILIGKGKHCDLIQLTPDFRELSFFFR